MKLLLQGLLSWKPGKNIFPQFSHSLHLKDGSTVPLVFLSPLDRIRTGRRDRSMQLGLNPSNNESFEANQSFPISQKVQHYDELPVTPMIKTCTMDKFRGSSNASAPNESHVLVFTGIIWVFANISGMVTILPNGTIHSCNNYFSLMLLGYSQTQLIGKNISFLILTFYDDLEFLDPDPLSLPFYDDNIGDILQENFIVNNEIKKIKNAPEILKKNWHYPNHLSKKFG